MRTQMLEVKVPDSERSDPHLRRISRESGKRIGGAVSFATVYQGRCWCGWKGNATLKKAVAEREFRNHPCKSEAK